MLFSDLGIAFAIFILESQETTQKLIYPRISNETSPSAAGFCFLLKIFVNLLSFLALETGKNSKMGKHDEVLYHHFISVFFILIPVTLYYC